VTNLVGANCVLMCLYVLNYVLRCALRFPHKRDVFSTTTPTPSIFSYKKQKLLSIREHLDSPDFGGLCIAHLSSFLCCVLFVFVLCLVYPMLIVSLDCPFLIAPSNIDNVYYTHLFMLKYFEEKKQSILVAHDLRGTQEVL